VRRPLLVRFERPAVVQVGRMHGVACGAQLTGETSDGTGEPERVVEDDDLGHRQSISTSICSQESSSSTQRSAT
jgi:hypothetical protein